MSRQPASSSLLRQVGSRVRSVRRDQGSTIRELAGRAGLSERFVAGVESGRVNISLLNLEQLGQALGLSVEQLVAVGSGGDARPVISLLGLRGAGKSSVGAALAKRRGVAFVELDRLVEREAGMSVAELFAMHGEDYFRRIELDALRHFLKANEPSVLATSGGVVTSGGAFRLLRERTRTVWLRATPEEHWRRVVRQGDLRPMKDRPAAMAELRRRLAEREALYALAEHQVRTTGRTIDAVVLDLDRELELEPAGSRERPTPK